VPDLTTLARLRIAGVNPLMARLPHWLWCGDERVPGINTILYLCLFTKTTFRIRGEEVPILNHRPPLWKPVIKNYY